MEKTGKSLGRVLGRCQEQLMEGSKQGQRVQATIAHLELQVQALSRDMQKLEIASIDKTRRCQLNRHEIRIECRTVVGAACGETSGVGGSIGSTDPGYVSQNKLLTPSQPTSSEYLKRSHNSRRRGRRGRDGDNQRQNKPQSGLSNAARFPFGCPFYFHDNEQHQSCLNYELKRIGDVRQHIYRFHVQPSHCPRCGIEFQNDIAYAQRDIHERQRICEATSEVRRYPGATSDQLASMSNPAAHRCSSTDEERWYAIWDIMFPSVSRPPSPYIDIRREWSRIEVHAAIALYRQNGGPQDFIRQWGPSFDVLGILNQFLNHFRDYSPTAFITTANPGDTRNASNHSYVITEAQSTIPIPSPSPPTQGLRILVSQPTTSPGVVLPVLLPQSPHIDSTNAERILPNLDPNHYPNVDADYNLRSFDGDYLSFGDGFSRDGDSDAI